MTSLATHEQADGQLDMLDAIAERDAEHAARRDSSANHWRAADDYAEFLSAVNAAADAYASDAVSQNDVRPLLFEDTIDGPRCRIDRNRYAGFWSRACREGWIEVDGYDICTTSSTGNNGKPQKAYRRIKRWQA